MLTKKCVRNAISLLLVLSAVFVLSACGKGGGEGGAREPVGQVLTDASVYEMYFDAPAPVSVWKSVTLKADGTPLTKQLYQRCDGFTFRITGYYGQGDLDAVLASELGYLEGLAEETHGGHVYRAAYYADSLMAVAAVAYNGTSYLVEYWGEDSEDYKPFLDGLRFGDAREEAPDMSMFALSYAAPAEYETLYWSAEENVGEGVYHKSITWEGRDAAGEGTQRSVSFDRNTDVRNKTDSRLTYDETEINGYPFLTAYADYAGGRYYAAQVGRDVYLVNLLGQTDADDPSFRAFLDSVRIAG